MHASFKACLLVSFCLSSVFAAIPQAFVGTWVISPNSTGITLTVKKTAAKTYAISWPNGDIEHVVADGILHKSTIDDTRQVSFQKTADNQWTLTTRHNSSPITYKMTVSSYGQTMINSTEMLSPKGELLRSKSIYAKTKPGQEIEGEWTATRTISDDGPRETVTIKSDEPSQLTIKYSSSKALTHFKSLNGSLYKEVEGSSKGEAASIKLLDNHTLIMTSYKNDSVYMTGKWIVSADRKTMSSIWTVKDNLPSL